MTGILSSVISSVRSAFTGFSGAPAFSGAPVFSGAPALASAFFTFRTCSGVSFPWSWTRSMIPAAAILRISSGSSSTNTPTARIRGSRSVFRPAACSGVTYRELFFAKTKPMKSGRRTFAAAMSSGRESPQSLIRTRLSRCSRRFIFSFASLSFMSEIIPSALPAWPVGPAPA